MFQTHLVSTIISIKLLPFLYRILFSSMGDESFIVFRIRSTLLLHSYVPFRFYCAWNVNAEAYVNWQLVNKCATIQILFNNSPFIRSHYHIVCAWICGIWYVVIVILITLKILRVKEFLIHFDINFKLILQWFLCATYFYLRLIIFTSILSLITNFDRWNWNLLKLL